MRLRTEVVEHDAGRQGAVLDPHAALERAAEHRRGRRLDRGLQVADVAGRREVLVLVGDAPLVHALDGSQAVQDGLDQLLGSRGASRDADRAREVGRQLVDVVDAVDPRASRLGGQLLEGAGVRRVGRADHDDGIALGGHRHESRLAVGGGEAEVRPAGRPEGREPLLGGVEHAGPVAVGQRRLGQQRDRLGELRQVVHLGDRLHPVDRIGRDGHGAHRLLMALVTDVDDPVALARPHPHLVVDLGHQRAHRVDHVAALGPGRRDHFRSRAVGRQHDRRAVGHVGDVVDEDHAQRLEAIDHHLVVDDLVVAVDGRLEGPHHPRQRLDRHLHAGTEAARRRQEHLVDLARAGDVH